MSDFDPYHIWLGIPETERPISKYRLLAIADFENNTDVINAAADRHTIYLRTLQAGEHATLVAEMLNEVSQARVTLLNADQKAAYDEQLREQQTPEPKPAPATTPMLQTTPSLSSVPSSTLVDDSKPVTQEFSISVVPTAKKPHSEVQKEIWKDPAVIGVSLVGVIAVLILLIGLMSSGATDPPTNTAGRSSVEMAIETAAMETAAMEKAAMETAAMEKAAMEKAAMEKAAKDKAAKEKAAKEKAAKDKAAKDKAAMEKAAMYKAAMEKAAKDKAAKDKATAAEKAAILARAPITNTIGMKLKEIPAGTFMMGSPVTEKDHTSDEIQHTVTISKAFYMQTTEVTQEQWKAVMGTEPWKVKKYVKEGPNYAASCVSWDDAVEYCKKLSEKEGKTYRLPTEAEWEYACRAGTETAWSFGDDEKDHGDYAWYDKNARDEKYAHQVGLKKPNAFGLYDMHGNVWAWCSDYYERDYEHSPEKDPTGPTSGSERVYRGGSWIGPTRGTRSAARGIIDAGYRGAISGFRLVRELDHSPQSAPPAVAATAPPIDSITNTIEMTFNKIPAGTFLMGSPPDETGRDNDEHQHKVTITKDFYMQTTEVTQGQWKALMSTQPWKRGVGKVIYGVEVKEGTHYPAGYLIWFDAVAFCKKLSEKEGKTYRLPTEAEWEYACRAGTETMWSCGHLSVLGDYAWYRENAFDIDEKYAHQVGLQKPNAFGLFDMHGNIREWCFDRSSANRQSPERDPKGPTFGSFRVLRGGSFLDSWKTTRSAARGALVPDSRRVSSGFRVVCELD